MRNFILIAVAAIGLAACTPDDNTHIETNSNGAVAADTDCGLASDTTLDEKALFSAESAYNVAAHSYVTLDAQGKLSAEVKAQARPALIAAFDGLKLARQAYQAADGCSLQRYVDVVQTAAHRAKGIMPDRQ